MEGGPGAARPSRCVCRTDLPWHLCIPFSVEWGGGARRSWGAVCLSGPPHGNFREVGGEAQEVLFSEPRSCQASQPEPDATAGHVRGTSVLSTFNTTRPGSSLVLLTRCQHAAPLSLELAPRSLEVTILPTKAHYSWKPVGRLVSSFPGGYSNVATFWSVSVSLQSFLSPEPLRNLCVSKPFTVKHKEEGLLPTISDNPVGIQENRRNQA